MGECAQRMQKPLTGLTPAAERLLFNAPWDGNVRELKNVVERACMLAEGKLLTEREIGGSLGPILGALGAGQSAQRASAARPSELQAVERGHIVEVLRQVSGNRMAAAKVLGISRRALYRRLERHHIVDAS